MKKITNFIVLGSVFLIIAGMVIFVIALSVNKWNFNGLSNSKVITNTYEIKDEFSSINIEEFECDINIEYINEGDSKVVVKEYTNRLHNVEVINDTLTVKEIDQRVWYEKLFDFNDTEMTIYINKLALANLNIDTSTGDIEVSDKVTFNNVTINGSTADVEFNAKVKKNLNIDLTTGDIDLENVSCNNANLEVSTGEIEIKNLSCTSSLSIKVSTGKVTLNNVTCSNLTSNGSTGKIYLTNVLVANMMEIERDTGDIKFDKCDAGELNIKTSTGDVTGSLLSNKIFNVETDTGKKKVPESLSGGKCKISTSTGDIIIEIVNN